MVVVRRLTGVDAVDAVGRVDVLREVDVVELDAGVDDRDVHRRAAGRHAGVTGLVRGPGTRAEDPVRRDLDRVESAEPRLVRRAGSAPSPRRRPPSLRTRSRRARGSRRRSTSRTAGSSAQCPANDESTPSRRVTIQVWRPCRRRGAGSAARRRARRGRSPGADGSDDEQRDRAPQPRSFGVRCIGPSVVREGPPRSSHVHLYRASAVPGNPKLPKSASRRRTD